LIRQDPIYFFRHRSIEGPQSGLNVYDRHACLDAEASEPDELAWWCARAESAARYLGS